MVKVMMLKVLLIPVILSLMFSLTIFNIMAQSEEPKVKINYECGTLDINARLNVNGFEPNSTVSWIVVSPKVESGFIFGYFDTNSTGGFNEFTHLSELEESDYSVQVFDDSNADGIPDEGKKMFTATMSPPIPCK